MPPVATRDTNIALVWGNSCMGVVSGSAVHDAVVAVTPAMVCW